MPKSIFHGLFSLRKSGFISSGLIFLFSFIFYYLLATRGTFHFPHDLDYFNPLAKSFIQGHLDISKPIENYDLAFYHGKWYLYWGPIPALFLIPPQLILKRYVPAAYLTILFGSFNVILVWQIIKQTGKRFLKENYSPVLAFSLLAFFALGTSHVYVAVRGGVWYVSQVIGLTSFLIAFWILLKEKLTTKDCFLASFFIFLNLLGRVSLVMLAILLALRLLEQPKKFILYALAPFVFWFALFMFYNSARFSGPLDNGYLYNLSYLDVKQTPYGLISWKYIPRNLELIFLELPKLVFSKGKFAVKFNLEGMSIFFTSPLYLASLLSLKIKQRFIAFLWLTTLGLILPIIILFSPGVAQFGIRYSLDFGVILIVLSLIGLRGKFNLFVLLTLVVSICLNIYGSLTF